MVGAETSPTAAVADEVGGEVPVIAGVGVESTHETVQNARRAASAGADGIVVVTPYYYPLSADGAVEHFSAAASATELPSYVYHIPSRTGNALSLETLDQIASVDGIAGVKDSSKDVPWLGQAVDAHPDLTFLGGSDSLLYTSLDIGCSGVVSAIANVFPEAVVELYEAHLDDDESRARELQSEIFAVRRALKDGSYMSGVKAALSLRENVPFDAGTPRSPLQPMSDEETARLESELDELNYLRVPAPRRVRLKHVYILYQLALSI